MFDCCLDTLFVVLNSGLLDIFSGDMPKSIWVQSKHCEALIDLDGVTGTSVNNIQHLESDIHNLMDSMKAEYPVYESFKQKKVI